MEQAEADVEAKAKAVGLDNSESGSQGRNITNTAKKKKIHCHRLITISSLSYCLKCIVEI